jgi:hypothetical protein
VPTSWRYWTDFVRVLVVTNMYPSPADPALGSFVRDQVRALRRIDGLDVALHAFAPGGRSYRRAARDLRARFRGTSFDVVHAHFGLSAWPRSPSAWAALLESERGGPPLYSAPEAPVGPPVPGAPSS